MKQVTDAKTSASRGGEVWLRGNARPAVMMALVMLVAAGAAVGAAVAFGWPSWLVAVVAMMAAVDALLAAGLAWAASRPRLVCRGGVLEIRLSPLGVERVPLEVVECVFPGTEPLGDDRELADRRVGTLVLRLAERASEWRSRSTLPAWGRWEDGSVVFDGRWCEPLSPGLAREVSTRLLEARRRVATESRP